MSEEEESRREELRGLFTIGLLAILITYRLQKFELVINFFGKEQYLTFLIDALIVFWLVYTFCMVYAYSGVEHLSDIFHSVGEWMMRISLVFTIVVAYALALNIHQDRSTTLLGLFGLWVIVWLFLTGINVIKVVSKIPKKEFHFDPNAFSQFFLFLFILSYLGIIFLPDENKNLLPYVIVISIVFLGVYALLRMLIITNYFEYYAREEGNNN